MICTLQRAARRLTSVLVAAPILVACARSPAPVAMPAAPSSGTNAARAEAGPAFAWQLPPGFPRPRVPEDNPMTVDKVELGRRLFYDRRLSGNETFSCASCHRQELAFTDGRARAVGSTGELHLRSSMSLANVVYNRTLTWADGSLEALEDQMPTPIFGTHPIELGLTGLEREVVARLEADPWYPPRFAAAFPDDPRIEMRNVIGAIAAFERTLLSGGSPYDRYVYLDDRDALSPTAKRGMRLFFSDRLACSSCHGGFNFSGPVRYVGHEEPAVFHNTGLYNVDGRGGYPPLDTGLHLLTSNPREMGQFRAPTLRNIAITAPYMHDGSVADLGAVIDNYARGGRELLFGPTAGDGSRNPFKSDIIGGFDLTADEKGELVAFLESLTDETFLTDPRYGDPFAADRDGD